MCSVERLGESCEHYEVGVKLDAIQPDSYSPLRFTIASTVAFPSPTATM